jgi:hypothetical protein
MAKRGWIIGGVVGAGALALVCVLAWRTAEILGVVAGGGVDLGVKLDAPEPARATAPSSLSTLRHDPGAARASSGDKEQKEGDKPGRAARLEDDPSDLLKMAPNRLALRHDARSAWRQGLSEEELAAVRERVREKQDGMTPEERADREARRQARREAIGLTNEPDPEDPELLFEEEPLPEPE